jgi:hypothetical protein
MKAALVACLLLIAPPALAETDPACFDDDLFKEPLRALVGRLVEQKAAPRGKQADPFFTLELDEGVCLNGSWRESVTRDIRSVQVFSQDGSKTGLLEKYRGRRVEIGFEYVFERRLSHHHRPMVGSVKNVAPL